LEVLGADWSNGAKKFLVVPGATVDSSITKDSLDKCSFIDFAASFVLMIIGVSMLHWWFMEMTMIFFVAAVVVGIIAGIKEKTFVETFIFQVRDLILAFVLFTENNLFC
jgi:uncharacterized ion transporter superfamily protein YfcC